MILGLIEKSFLIMVAQREGLVRSLYKFLSIYRRGIWITEKVLLKCYFLQKNLMK